MANEKELAALREELTELRQALETLKRSVADARGRVSLGMKEQIRCPQCGARRLAHYASVPDFGHGNIVEKGLGTQKKGLFRITSPDAPVSATVCTACGLVEWHVRDTSVFAEESEQFDILTSDDPSQGPYR